MARVRAGEWSPLDGNTTETLLRASSGVGWEGPRSRIVTVEKNRGGNSVCGRATQIVRGTESRSA